MNQQVVALQEMRLWNDSYRKERERLLMENRALKAEIEKMAKHDASLPELPALPEGYRQNELPKDYTGRVWIEGQVRRYGAKCVESVASTTAPEPSVEVSYWDSYYHADEQREKPFLISINDQRKENGQLYVDIDKKDDPIENTMSATIEINRLPGSDMDTQCLHLHFDGSNLAASFFKQGEKIYVRPEEGVFFSAEKLPNGERGLVISM